MSKNTLSRWYDPHIRLWVIQILDERNAPVSNSMSAATRAEAYKITLQDFGIADEEAK